jgi:hypothetical protein
LLSLFSVLSADADTWTNRAGHVIAARLVGIEGEQVVLQHTNGRTWRLPLSSLHPADQQRAREQTGTEPIPSELSACLTQAQEDIHRAAQFLHRGKITPEEYAARCEAVRQRFEHLGRQALKDRGEELHDELLDRLKQRLAEDQQRVERSVPKQ